MRSILESFEVKQVQLVTTYDETAQILKNRTFDCIFMDNMMSPKNGLELTTYIRHLQDQKKRAIPIILCTAFTGLKSIIQARDAGVTEVLSKPVSPEQIMRKMTNALFNQRTFIDTGIYSGPDRRRRIRDYNGDKDRRGSPIPLPSVNQDPQEDQ
ncbi:MAG: response regulator [Emcibacter sp.]|nr:response regulator [Emcibacter sp.]